MWSASTFTGSLPNACTASQWKSTFFSRQIAPIWRTGCSTPISLLACITLTSTVSGPIAGAVVYKLLSIWLISHTDYSKLVLGLVIIGLVLLFPKGIGGSIRLPHLRRVAAPREKAAA